MAMTYDAGIATAYGAAVRGGYTGSYAEFCKQQAEYAQNAADMETNTGKVETWAEATRTNRNSAAQSAAQTAARIMGDSQEWEDDAGGRHTEAAPTSSWTGANGETKTISASAAGYAQQAREEAIYARGRAEAAAESAETAGQHETTSGQNAAAAAEQNRLAGISAGAAALARTAAEQAMTDSQTIYNNIGPAVDSAISQIEEKTEESLDSIPDDYTEMTRKLAALELLVSKMEMEALRMDENGDFYILEEE